MMFSFLKSTLATIIRNGTLEIIDRHGRKYRFGDDRAPYVRIRINDPLFFWKLSINPDMALGQGYVDGGFTIERGSLYKFLHLTISQYSTGSTLLWRLFNKKRQIGRWLQQLNTLSRARRNVAHHYDLSGRFYDLFLDADRQYSCAYFEKPQQSLERAQLAKKRHIAAKLALEPGQRVLDIGCGWGGLAIYLAEMYDVHVTGVTLSREQYELANQRICERGLEQRVDIRLQDYRQLKEPFDRIVSVGMFEHVGKRSFADYFAKVYELLSEDGVALIHTIGRPGGPNTTSPWIRKYIFPGGYLPALSEISHAVEASALYLTDTEVLRTHYAETLSQWAKRFTNNRASAAAIYDETFCRMWEYYLTICEVAFRVGFCNVFQFQLAKHQYCLPQTRDYMFEEERRLRQIEQSRVIKSLRQTGEVAKRAAKTETSQ